MNELIQQARELRDAAKSAKERGDALDSAAMSWAITNNCVPQLCDALEAAEKEIGDLQEYEKLYQDICDKHQETFHKMESAIKQLTDRAEKAEAELSELRAQRLEIPQTAIAIKMDTPVQIGHVRFRPGCTIWKCPFCGRFLTPIHKFCSNCGQAVSFPAPEKEE